MISFRKEYNPSSKVKRRGIGIFSEPSNLILYFPFGLYDFSKSCYLNFTMTTEYNSKEIPIGSQEWLDCRAFYIINLGRWEHLLSKPVFEVREDVKNTIRILQKLRSIYCLGSKLYTEDLFIW